MVRLHLKDLVYRTEQGKWDAVIAEVGERNVKGQPVLIGTTSVEKSQTLSEELERHGFKHDVLNCQEPRARGPHHRRRRSSKVR